jgi:transposase
MMGRQRRDRGRLFYEFRLEDRIPENHLLLRMNMFVTAALADLHKELKPHYSEIGRPSIDPELMIRMLIVGYCYGTRSERMLCQEVELHLAYRWFCKLDVDDKVPHHSTFSENRLAGSASAICYAISLSAWCGQRWRWVWSRGKALPSTRA